MIFIKKRLKSYVFSFQFHTINEIIVCGISVVLFMTGCLFTAIPLIRQVSVRIP